MELSWLMPFSIIVGFGWMIAIITVADGIAYYLKKKGDANWLIKKGGE